MHPQRQKCFRRHLSCRRRNVVTMIPILVVSLQLLVSLLGRDNLICMVHAQRAIVSLGSKLKKSPTENQSARRRDYVADSALEDDIVIQDDHVVAMGGLDRVDLAFRGIRLELETKTKKKESATGGDKTTTRTILDGSIHGRAQPGRMVAIMGPSGAGKSSVLHALAGRIKERPNVALYGERFINGQLVSGDSMIPSAFVPQEINFFPYMTVRETLTFRIELKLGSQLSKTARAAMVTDLMEQVNLQDVADTIVGGTKVRGISGGERRRLMIACELISSPAVLFLDEPTTGLDSTAAASLVDTLRALADAGKTIIAVIHQPSQNVFASFDDLLLVAQGKQMFFGKVAGVRQYMDEHGCRAPFGIGTAEHVLDCVSVEPLPGESEEEALERVDRLAHAAMVQPVNLGPTDLGGGGDGEGKALKFAGHQHQGGPKANILVQFKLLLKRALRESFRGKAKIILQVVQQVSLGIIYGGIYKIGTNQGSIQDRIGILWLIATGTTNMAVAASLRAFPREKAIVSNEIASKMYGTLPYFVGKAISELPLAAFFSSVFAVLVSSLTGLHKTKLKWRRFLGLNSLHSLASQSVGLLLGAISPSSDVALALLPPVIILNMIFDGKHISEESIPRVLRWIPKLGLVRWGYEGFCLNEFEGLKFDTTSGPQRGPVAKTGADALARFGLGGKTLNDVVRAQGTILSSCWFLSYLGLALTKQKFEVMKPPKVP